MPFAKNSIEPTRLSRARLGKEYKFDLDCISNNTLGGLLRQLSSLAVRADAIFSDIAEECVTVVKKTQRIRNRIGEITKHVDKLNAKAVTVPTSLSKTKMEEREETFDRRGYHTKEYQPRVEPFERWREAKFVSRYRLSKQRVLALAEDYGRVGRTKGTRIGGGLPHYNQMCLAVRYLATGANFSTIAETQGVSIATVSRCVKHVCRYFYYYHHRYITWPETLEDKTELSDRFHEKHGEKPLVFGVIDGTHIPIISPSQGREPVFVNRKGYYSLNAMVVSDADNRIIHINPCFAGSAQDSYCYNNSELHDEAEDGMWEDFLLLGDSGYGLKRNLFTPYLNPQTDAQRKYNTWHRSTRSLVERTIGLLKQRWRCLDASGGYLHHSPERVARIVIACACLHNCAIEDRVPHHDREDDEDDRFIWRQPPPPQPDAEQHGRGEEERERERETPRDEYVRLQFRPNMQVAGQAQAPAAEPM